MKAKSTFCRFCIIASFVKWYSYFKPLDISLYTIQRSIKYNISSDGVKRQRGKINKKERADLNRINVYSDSTHFLCRLKSNRGCFSLS